MSRARHETNRAKGGRTEMKVSGNPDVFKEAEDKHGTMKRGGKVKHRAKGGGLAPAKAGKDIGLMTGGAVRPRLDRPGRKRGGGVGSDTSPLSTAHKGHADGHETPSSRDTYGGTPAD